MLSKSIKCNKLVPLSNTQACYSSLLRRQSYQEDRVRSFLALDTLEVHKASTKRRYGGGEEGGLPGLAEAFVRHARQRCLLC